MCMLIGSSKLSHWLTTMTKSAPEIMIANGTMLPLTKCTASTFRFTCNTHVSTIQQNNGIAETR